MTLDYAGLCRVFPLLLILLMLHEAACGLLRCSDQNSPLEYLAGEGQSKRPQHGSLPLEQLVMPHSPKGEVQVAGASV